MNPVIVIQARMGSTRLPGKTLMPITGKPLIDWVLEGADEIKNANDLVVAITENRNDDVLADYLSSKGVECFRGSTEDVLGRFYNAALLLNADPVIRLCADSPLPSAGFMDALIEEHGAYSADLSHCATMFPLGSAGEAISFSALEKMYREAERNPHREHVTPFIHENPGLFRIHRVIPPVWMQRNYRLTVDTLKDLQMMEALFAAIIEAGLEPNFTNALAILDARPEIGRMNAGVKQKNWREE